MLSPGLLSLRVANRFGRPLLDQTLLNNKRRNPSDLLDTYTAIHRFFGTTLIKAIHIPQWNIINTYFKSIR
jgi:hypothetical protein